MMWRWLGLMMVVVGLGVGQDFGTRPGGVSVQTEINVITSIAWNREGRRIAIGNQQGGITIRDALAGQVLVTMDGHHSSIESIAWNPSETQVASSSMLEFKVWNATTGQQIADLNNTFYSIQGFYAELIAISWNQNGMRLMAFTFDGATLQVWDASTFQLLTVTNDAPFSSISWSIDRNHVMAGTTTGGAVALNPLDFSSLSIASEAGTYTGAWSLGAQQIVTGNWVGNIRIWDVPSSDKPKIPLPEMNVAQNLRISDQPYSFPITYSLAVAFSLSGSRVYSVSGSGEFAVWDANQGDMISSTQLPDAPITAAAFNQLGTQLAYGDANGMLHIVDVAELVTPENLGDSIALFRASDGQATLINLPPNAVSNNPTLDNLISYDTGAPDDANYGQWVMGDWDGDGVATPGVYGPNGVFYYTDGLGPSSRGATTNLGLAGGVVVAGRFGDGGHDCVGVVAGMAFTTTCDFSGNTIPLVQRLDIEFPTDADLQYGAGDFDGDGVDSIVIRHGNQIFHSNTLPNTATVEFQPPIEFPAPEDGPSQLVVGDWDTDGVDDFGMYFVETGHFYGRTQTDGPLIEQQLDTSGAGVSNISVASWRFR
ncbi:MAG: hypothetical protein K8L91_33485 [Anaerolineae bacterium]|nr:hypothetical protein [Anaerolineae bacterium]